MIRPAARLAVQKLYQAREDFTGLSQPARDFAWRLSLFYALSSSIMGIYGPYMPVFLEHRGLSPPMIGLMMSLPSFIRVLSTPAITVIYDRCGDARWLVAAIAGAMLVGFILLALTSSLAAIVCAIIIYALVGPAIMPLTDTLAMQGVDGHRLNYGQMRLWGSLAFILATFFGASAIDALGAESLPTILIGMTLFILGGSALLPTPPKAATEKADMVKTARFADIGLLLASPSFAIFMIATSLIQASHALLYSFATLHWQARDISAFHIGGLWGVGVVAEIALFAVATMPLRLFGARGLILVGAASTTFRFFLTGFDPPLPVLYFLQAMHALTFGCAHLGAMYLISEAVPRRLAGTAQGLYAALAFGLAMGLSALASGWLYGAFGVHSFWVMAAIGAVSLWPAWVLWCQRGPLLDEAPQ
jgi:MFS transporter, PPP family, 3-phenylpropionic acid transporter